MMWYWWHRPAGQSKNQRMSVQTVGVRGLLIRDTYCEYEGKQLRENRECVCVCLWF